MNQLRLVVMTVVTLAFIESYNCLDDTSYDTFYDFRGEIAYNWAPFHVEEEKRFAGKGCERNGILQIILETSGVKNRRAQIDMEFDNPEGRAFNLGDSFSNNGLGGGASNIKPTAEIYASSYYPNGTRGLKVKSDSLHPGKGTPNGFELPAFFKTSLTIIVGDNTLNFHSNSQVYSYPGLFNLTASNKLYLGVNEAMDEGWKRGSGLCTVGIKLLDAL